MKKILIAIICCLSLTGAMPHSLFAEVIPTNVVREHENIKPAEPVTMEDGRLWFPPTLGGSTVAPAGSSNAPSGNVPPQLDLGSDYMDYPETAADGTGTQGESIAGVGLTAIDKMNGLYQEYTLTPGIDGSSYSSGVGYDGYNRDMTLGAFMDRNGAGPTEVNSDNKALREQYTTTFKIAL